MRQPVIIGDQVFATQTAARDACRRLIHGGLGTLAGERVDFAIDLLESHPRRDIKIGCGVAAIEVRPNPQFPTNRGLWIIRTDGSVTDFSFNECLKPTDHRRKVLRAMRTAIGDQIVEYKQQCFGEASTTTCAITGTAMTWHDCHVDHYDPTFHEMADTFAADEGGWDRINVADSGDEVIGVRLADNHIWSKWTEYHRRNAHLRLVTPLANLSTLRIGCR